jgi:hypothetical protein
VTEVVSALSQVNYALVAKTSELQQEAGITRALCEFEAWNYRSPGLVIEGYVEATFDENSTVWLWKWALTRQGEEWDLDRRLERTRLEEWELLREFPTTRLSDSSELASTLPALVDELLDLRYDRSRPG